MKKLFIMLLLCGMGISLSAQQHEQSLFERLFNMEKKTELFNLYFNMHAGFDARFNYDGVNGLTEGAFKFKQLRIEAKGNINSWLSYRYRQRLNRSNDGSGNVDNMPTSIDIAGIGVNLGERFSLFLGKQCAAYGGIEFDLNPIEIYEYSDMVEYMSNFLSGVNIAFQVHPNHQLQLQILNSLNGPSRAMYGYIAAAGIEEAKLPLVYTLNWNGNFHEGMFKTRWSASVMNEAKEKQMYYFALGNEMTMGFYNMFFDVMYSREDLDRKGIMSSHLGGWNNLNGHTALNAEYLSLVAKFNFRLTPKWNLFFKGMYETASLSKERDNFEKGKYSTSYGYLTGIEYYPLENSNLHFFANFTGRSYKYTSRATLQSNHDTQRVSVGFIYQLPAF